MKLDINCVINLPDGETVQMSAKRFVQFFDELTVFYNDHYQALNKTEE